MWNLFGCTIASVILASLVPSTTADGLFGSLLGDNNENNNNPNIPLIGALGLGSNANDQNRANNNFNQYTNNNNQFINSNANRGLLSALGVNNANVNRPNVNTFNRYPNIGQNNPTKNINDLKNQLQEAQERLEKIKEMNKLKEQQILDKQKGNNQGQVNPAPGNTKPDISSDNVNNYGDSGNNGALKSLTKKKFYFMVKPVVPENEANNHNQTVFYVD